jgi:LPS export ABC transporter protein LptC
MVFLLYQKPYIVEINSNAKKEANIEMFQVLNYSITQDGISHIVKADRVLRYKDHDEFYKVDSIRKSKINHYETLLANSGTLKQDDLKLYGNVRYTNSDSVKFNSDEAEYNLKSKVFKTNMPFTLEDKRTITYGTSLTYQTKDGKIYANNIKSKTEVEKK